MMRTVVMRMRQMCVRGRAIIATALALTLAALVSPAPDLDAQRPPDPSASVAQLQPGDLIRITVWRKPEFSGEFTIDQAGTPRHPLYKDIRVAGVPIADAERRIIELLKSYEQNPQVVIEPLFRVSVSGEVNSPALLTLPRETTVLQAIALAGGPSQRGTLQRVRIVRGTQTVDVDLTSPTAEWARRTVLSGDQILLVRRRNYLTEFVTPFAAIVGALAAIINITKG